MTSGAPPLEFDLSGLGLRLHGLRSDLRDRLEEHWKRFRVADRVVATLDVEVRIEGTPVIPSPTMSRAMSASRQRDCAAFRLEEGSIEVDRSGTARARLSPGDPGRQYWGLINLLALALGWLLPGRGATTLHAAGIVLDGRAFVLLGPEGAGKTTWARVAEAGGAQVLSDDIVVVDASSDPVVALSTPFRADDFALAGPGRWPIAALLVPEHGASASLEPVGKLVLTARLTASLFTDAEHLEADPGPTAIVERLAADVPSRTLVFTPSDSFLSLLREMPDRRS